MTALARDADPLELDATGLADSKLCMSMPGKWAWSSSPDRDPAECGPGHHTAHDAASGTGVMTVGTCLCRAEREMDA